MQRISHPRFVGRRGLAFVLAMIALVVLMLVSVTIIRLGMSSREFAVRQQADAIATNLADAGVEQAAQLVQAGSPPTEAALDLTGFQLPTGGGLVTMAITPVQYGYYHVVSTAQVQGSTKTIDSLVNKYPISKVFDYVYFLNNWGWYFGYWITSYGDVRANGRFDLRDQPYVDGHIHAHFEVDDGGDGVRGLASSSDYRHPYDERVDMPNLLDLSYYSALSAAKHGSLTCGGQTVIADGETFTGDVVLVGTDENPIVVNGPVVFSGDVIVKGKVTGKGVIYAGRNVYLADNTTYVNGPTPPTPPSRSLADRDQWVADNGDKDLVCYAARGSIVQGDYTGTHGGNWYAQYWLFNAGNEDVGLDGIPDTGDEGEGDGIFQPESEDLDNDGQFRNWNYGWSDVQIENPIQNFSMFGLDQDEIGDIDSYADLATNNLDHVAGIFFTNHFYAGRCGYDHHISGSVICKDEAIIYRDKVYLEYDERINSRYQDDPNNVIDLGLFPPSPIPEIAYWHERHAELY